MKRIGSVLVFLLAAGISLPVFAQDIKTDSYFRYFPASDAKLTDGKVSITEAESQASYEVKAFDKLPVEFTILGNYKGIDDNRSLGLPSQLTEASMAMETTLPLFGVSKTYVRFAVMPSFFGDSWDFDSSSFRIPFRSYVIYRPSDKFTVIAGAAVYPEFDSSVLPIVGLIYQPNERLSFNLVPKRPNISYMLTPRITVFGEGGGAFNSEYEVNRDNMQNAMLRYKETHLGAGAKIKANDKLYFIFSCGESFNRSFKYLDHSGKIKLDSGFYAELRVKLAI